MSRTPKRDRVGTTIAVAGVLCLAWLLTSCGRSAIGAQLGAVPRPSPQLPTIGFTPASASPSATPSAPPTATTPPKPVNPLDQLSKKTKAEFSPCLNKTIGPGSGGKCAKLVQKKLKSSGYYPWRISNYINTAGVNAILNYQRSRGLPGTGKVVKKTWLALATKAPKLPQVLPKKCSSKGVWLCVDQAHRKLFWVKNGKLVKTFKVRLGGWNYYPKTHKWKVFATANGTWRVYDKLVNPPSENYGSGAMPYSTIFYPDMYVHYSPGFRSVGYATSSHGCVNIGKLSDAQWIFKHTPIGAKVYIYSPKAA